jgi:hypothetical protein
MQVSLQEWVMTTNHLAHALGDAAEGGYVSSLPARKEAV